jgi:hypothetical protein
MHGDLQIVHAARDAVRSVGKPVDTSETDKRRAELEVMRPLLDTRQAFITEKQRE